MAEHFPDDVRRFLDAYVESIDQLEILRVLWEDPDADWTESNLAAEVQVQPADLAGHLTALRGRGVLRAETRGGVSAYRHGARDAELDGLLRKVLQHYRERPVSMIKFVAARQRDPLRRFADAFRLRPREGE